MTEKLRQRILAGIAVAVFLLVLFAYWWVFLRDPNAVRSPATLEKVALTDSNAEARQQAAVELARHPDKPLEHLRRVFAQSQDPAVKAAVALGLGRLEDWESVPVLLDALENDSPEVRANAALAVNKLLGIDYLYRASDPPEKRARKVKAMRHMYEQMDAHVSSTRK